MALFWRAFQWGAGRVKEKTGVRQAFLALSLGQILMLGACATTTPPQQGPIVEPPVATGPVAPETDKPDSSIDPDGPPDTDGDVNANTLQVDEVAGPRDGLTPPHMANRNIKRLALVLPFSSSRAALRKESDSLLKAAEMAVFAQDANDVLLVPFDSQGTASGTRKAVKEAIKSGADVILGPILSKSVRDTQSIAAASNVPVIGFSTDQKAAGGGAYLLSFPPEAEINRVVNYAVTSGLTRFAFLGPDSAYGRRVKDAYESAVTRAGGQITASETYKGKDISAMQGPAQKLARLFARTEERRGALDPYAFEAIILPESGVALRTLAPLLTFYEDDLRKVQFLGTAQWQDDETAREPALNGGIFAGPDVTERERFQASFDRIYGQEPGRLASLAFDAVTIGSFISDSRAKRRDLEDPSGFYGVDGLIRFRADGTPDRALAIYEVRNGRIVVLDPAPKVTLDPS